MGLAGHTEARPAGFEPATFRSGIRTAHGAKSGENAREHWRSGRRRLTALSGGFGWFRADKCPQASPWAHSTTRRAAA
jgi:hypothetical protein